MTEPTTPESIKPHAQDYLDGAWRRYTLAELGWWVHLFHKRASHRRDPAKRAKDLRDARNYLEMMAAHLDAARVNFCSPSA